MPRSGQPPIAPNDELGESFQTAPAPPRGPDGAPVFVEGQRPYLTPPPRLCEAGPCVNYHRFELVMDVQQPMAIRAGGTVTIPDEVFHTKFHHYCYPTSGIELDLGDQQILSCNRFVSKSGAIDTTESELQFFDRRLAEWKANRRAELERAARAAAIPAVAGTVTLRCLVFAVKADPTHLGQRFECEVVINWETPMREVAEQALVECGNQPGAGVLRRHVPGELEVTIQGDTISNMDATPAHLGLASGDYIVVTKYIQDKETTAP